MLHITLGADDLVAVAYERYHHPEPIVQRKMTVLWLKTARLAPSRDRPPGRRFPGFHVTRYLKEFSSRRLGCYPPLPLERTCRGQTRTTTGSAWKSTSVSIRHTLPSTSPADHRTTDRPAPRPDSGLRRFLLRLGLCRARLLPYRYRPRARFPNTSEEQRQLSGRRTRTAKLREARAGLRDVYFVDASHFVFGSFLGIRVVLCAVVASGRPRAASVTTVLGALHAVSHQLIRVVNHGYINATSVCDLLRAVAAASVGRPITLVLDNARYQKCALVQELARSLKIHLLFLPSYSPNLNLIERVWKFVKKECLQSVQHASYEAFTAAIDNCLAKLSTTHKKDMKTLLAHKFQMFDSVSMVAA